MRFVEPLLLFIGSFLSLGLFGYVAHLVYQLAESADKVGGTTTSIMVACFVLGVLSWFVMIMWAIWLIVNPSRSLIQNE